ncbi:hypothetical protein PoB_007004000 [Plakobranchus ocellatus]|uniref:Uncharacterized protein n=1 Tax=Plakobranchus ocellatus TaxID=259542 RepID=A0AAV4DHU6_9GAST|nr:hypothetical protein PoB_007004000 [Plakobranchus ocellatus]
MSVCSSVSPDDECNPQQDDLRLLGPPSGQGAGSGTRTRDRRVPADLRADSLTTIPPTPKFFKKLWEILNRFRPLIMTNGG